MSGFVAAYREVVEHPLFAGNADRLGAWMWLVMKAAWKPTKFDVSGKTITVERGQLSVSIRHLAEAWGWSKSSTERFLTRLKTETMIETQSGTGRLLITVCNYDKYQDVSESSGTPSGTPSGTAAGQQRDIKEQGNKGTIVKDDKSSSIELPIEQPEKPPSEIDQAVECWNLAAKQAGWPVARSISTDRRGKLKSRLREHKLEGWKAALRRALRGEQLGRDPPTWFTFDWLTKNSGNILKVLEGNYDKRFGSSNGNGNAKLGWRDAFDDEHGRDFPADDFNTHPPTDGVLRLAAVGRE